MAASLAVLTPEFQPKAERLLADCAALGVTMRPCFTLRDPLDQAKLWRQSRSIEEITAKIAKLKSDGAPFLADCIERVGSQHGKAEVTKAIPGLSWHQWGEAMDCFWLDGTGARWDGQGYEIYRACAAKLGLTQISWERDHVQLRPYSSPLSVYGLPEIDRQMQQRFGAVVGRPHA